MVFANRRHAGRILAAKLDGYRDRDDVVVLGLPRGGVPVAYEVARALQAPLDVFLVRKLGLPGHEELAIGAISSGDVVVLSEELLERLNVSRESVQRVVARERNELERQRLRFRRGRAPLPLTGRTVLLVDDGLATGSSMRAAIEALRRRQAQSIVVAAPVGAAETCAEIRELADDVVCAIHPIQFYSVGSWYADFSQVSDEEVESLLDDAARRQYAGAVGGSEAAKYGGV